MLEKHVFFWSKMTKYKKKYKQIWNLIKNELSIKFHRKPIYEEKYLKAKVKEFDGVIKTNFLGYGVPNKRKYALHLHCLCNHWICYENCKKNYSQVYLEERKYRVKKIQMSRFISTELDSDSDSEADSEAETKSDNELMAKLKSSSDSE